MASKQTYLTIDGLHQLEDELDHLRAVRRQEVAARIQEAKEVGGTTDNAEYEEAKEELAFVEGRIQTIEAMIQSAVIIPDHSKGKRKSEIVELGSIVTIEGMDNKRKNTYTIVGSTEASPADGRISNESPIGKALLGKKAGDQVQFTVPAGVQHVKIISVK